MKARSAPSEDQTTVIDTLRAVTCTKATPDLVPAEVVALVEASVANIWRAYQTDLAHFAAWGSELPAELALVASYLAAPA